MDSSYDLETASTLVLPNYEPQVLTSQNQALNRQKVQVLFSDVENIRNLHKLYTDSKNDAQFSILFRRVTQCQDRMDELINSVVLTDEQLTKFQQDKQYLDSLSFELAGQISKDRKEQFDHLFFGHGHFRDKIMKRKWKQQCKWNKKTSDDGSEYW